MGDRKGTPLHAITYQRHNKAITEQQQKKERQEMKI
jgi:hypothetical protein